MHPMGFVDLQVNGWGGIDFSAPGLTVDKIRAVTRSLVERGTAAYCPTVITAAPGLYEENFPVLAKAMTEPDLQGRLLGIHLEGPFLSEPSRGAHPAEALQAPDAAAFDRWQEAAGGRIRILTVAPEGPGADDLIRHAVSRGVLVSLGHHLADNAAIDAAIAAGACACTHLGNGIPLMLPRHPNPIWTQLARDELTAMVIADGHHLPDEFLTVVRRVKTPARLIAVSDASPPAGLPPGLYPEQFGGVSISPEGRISPSNGEGLAGSYLDLMSCMNRWAALGGWTEEDLFWIGRDHPLHLLGLSRSALDGLDGPRVVFENGRFRVVDDRAEGDAVKSTV